MKHFMALFFGLNCLHRNFSILAWAIMHRVCSTEITVHYRDIAAFLCCFLKFETRINALQEARSETRATRATQATRANIFIAKTMSDSIISTFLGHRRHKNPLLFKIGHFLKFTRVAEFSFWTYVQKRKVARVARVSNLALCRSRFYMVGAHYSDTHESFEFDFWH